MKKYMGVLLAFIVILLSGCSNPEEETLECTSGTESQQALCSEFNSVSLLGKEVLVDLELHNYNENEDFNWMNALAQHKEFYDSLLPFIDNLSFDDSSVKFEENFGGMVKVIYDDGVNSTITKSFVSKVYDVTKGGTIATPVIGEAILEADYFTYTFTTLDNEHFYAAYEIENQLFVDSQRIYRHYGFHYSDLHVNAEVTGFGYSLTLTINPSTENEQVIVYEILSYEKSTVNPEYSFEVPNITDSIWSFVADDNFQYEITEYSHNAGTATTSGEFVVKSDDGILLSTTFDFTEEGDFVELQPTTNDYIVHIGQEEGDKFVILLQSKDTNTWYHFVVII